MMTGTQSNPVCAQSICFISNRLISPEAAMFTTALCGHNLFSNYCLNTACATRSDIIAFNEWKNFGRPIRLIISPDNLNNPDKQQKIILEDVKNSGGIIQTIHQHDPVSLSSLKTQIHLSDYIVIIEIDAGHPLLDYQMFNLTPSNTAVFQWAIPKFENRGCQQLYQSGRGTPLYPAWRNIQLADFLAGKPFSNHELRQGELGL